MEALADDMNRELERYPVIHAWSIKNGSQLTFWCQYCKDHHTHGRHLGTSRLEAVERWDSESNWVPRTDTVVPLEAWKAYLQKFADCRFHDNVRGGRGF